MSTALGIASVTHVIKDLLNNGLIDNDVGTTIGSNVEVSSLPPSLLESSSGTTPTQLNLFLYRVSPNTGWQNIGYPSRNTRGTPTNRPPLALDLHYLLTAFGDSELHAEILLGYGMQLLHETPVLDRSAIRRSLTLAEPGNAGTLPENLRQLATSELAEQIEQVKITPETLNTEEISKLWAAIQSKYRPCTTYAATVVLIESKKPTVSPLPVRERKIYSFPFKQPVIQSILAQTAQGDELKENQQILVGHRLLIRGLHLKGRDVSVLINQKQFTPVPDDIRDTELLLDIPASLMAGLQGVQVVHSIRLDHSDNLRRGVESNLKAFVLSPEILHIDVVDDTVTGDDLLSAQIDVEVQPAIHPRQKVILLLNEWEPPSGESPASYQFWLPASELAGAQAPVSNLSFTVSSIRPGNYLVRIQVDGAESPLFTDSDDAFESPQINIS